MIKKIKEWAHSPKGSKILTITAKTLKIILIIMIIIIAICLLLYNCKNETSEVSADEITTLNYYENESATDEAEYYIQALLNVPMRGAVNSTLDLTGVTATITTTSWGYWEGPLTTSSFTLYESGNLYNTATLNFTSISYENGYRYYNFTIGSTEYKVNTLIFFNIVSIDTVTFRVVFAQNSEYANRTNYYSTSTTNDGTYTRRTKAFFYIYKNATNGYDINWWDPYTTQSAFNSYIRINNTQWSTASEEVEIISNSLYQLTLTQTQFDELFITGYENRLQIQMWTTSTTNSTVYTVTEEVTKIEGTASGSYESGYIAGYNSGYIGGYSEGEAAGYTNGYSEGEAAGYANGYSEGSQTSYQSGYDNGYNIGYQNGYDDGYESEFNIITEFLAPIDTFLSFKIGDVSLGTIISIILFVWVATIFLKFFAGG